MLKTSNRIFIIYLALSCFFYFRLAAQIKYPVSYRSPDTINVKADSSFTISVAFDVENSWYIYAPTGNNAEKGMVETNVIYQLPKGFTRKGKMQQSKFHYKGGFEVFEGKDIGMTQEFVVDKDLSPGNYIVKAKITYQTCKDQICLPPRTENVDIKVVVHANGIKDDIKNQLIKLQFTSMDGRQIDLAKLKGKLVLIDCWATWCRPCIAEFNNLTALYKKYHSRGLEIIGVSADTEFAKTRVNEIIAEYKLAWPQSFEGKGFEENSFIKANNISSLPAVFLLDKDGNIIDRDARGEKLEGLIQKYLK